MGQFGLILVQPSIQAWWKICDWAQGKILIYSPIAKSWKHIEHSEHFDIVSDVTWTISGNFACLILCLQQQM